MIRTRACTKRIFTWFANLLLAVALVCGLVPSAALAAVSDGNGAVEAAAENGENSWRYDDGELATSATGETTAAASAGSLSTLSTVASWTKSNGTSSYQLGSTSVSISGVKRVGIDVSYHNGTINWTKVKAAGISYAIIRCGYGSDYESQDDSMFLENVEGALAAGLQIGVYLYSYATKTTGTTSAASEAEHVLRLLDEAGLEPSDLGLPVFYDLEESSQAALGATMLGKLASTFCTAIEQEGYVAGIYASKSWWESYLTASVFESRGWYRWVARYSTSTSTTSTGIDDTSMWQFTSKGTVSGISGNVDVNFDFLGKGKYTAVNLAPTAASASTSSIKVSWTKLSTAYRYEIARKKYGGSWDTYRTTSSTSLTDTGLTMGTTYCYRVRAVFASGGTLSYGAWSTTTSAYPRPSTVSSLSLSLASSLTKITVKWGKVSNATGYQIYRSVSGGSYTKVKTVTSASTTSWANSSLSLGKTYKYKVRAYKTSGSKTVYGAFSSAKSKKTVPGTPTITSVTSTKSRSGTVKWGKVTGATGYQVAYRRKGSSTWYYVTVTTNSKTFTSLNVKNYYVKVRAYKKSGGTKYYGSWSSQKAMTVK